VLSPYSLPVLLVERLSCANSVFNLQFDFDKLVLAQIEDETPCIRSQIFSKIRRIFEKLQVTSNAFLETESVAVSKLTFAHYAYQIPKRRFLFPRLGYWQLLWYGLGSFAA
jgi:hypothetical protein